MLTTPVIFVSLKESVSLPPPPTMGESAEREVELERRGVVPFPSLRTLSSNKSVSRGI